MLIWKSTEVYGGNEMFFPLSVIRRGETNRRTDVKSIPSVLDYPRICWSLDRSDRPGSGRMTQLLFADAVQRREGRRVGGKLRGFAATIAGPSHRLHEHIETSR